MGLTTIVMVPSIVPILLVRLALLVKVLAVAEVQSPHVPRVAVLPHNKAEKKGCIARWD